MSRPATLGQLRESGWRSRPVKVEVRRNAVAKIAAGEPLFPGVLGFEETVLPQLENAVLAAHDVIFLGERGQAKTRMIRAMVGLLDEWLPIVAGSEINDDPYSPVSRYARDLVRDHRDDTPIEWVYRDTRYGEKLATPDTSIADLIGEVDPIKVAEGRYLSDELTLHYGLVPRTNRGRIITPLKDRFGSQIRTHYPLETDMEIAIIDQEARSLSAEGLTVTVPGFMTEIVAEISQLARRSPHINQRSGVSVRLTVSNYETLVANATRRALRSGERDVVPRVSDLDALAASTVGKVEIESLEDGRDDHVVEQLLQSAVLTTFRDRFAPDQAREILDAFEGGTVVHTGEDIAAADYVALVRDLPSLRGPVSALTGGDETPGAVASAVEFVLEGLHLGKRLNKDSVGSRATYRGRG